ncbi:MAG: DegT/DnrJ/EryC1/StrS family aminotransferase, partial [Proteobacteria bacterium]|nr:DegT/DnrJ/EryC1/StrS family aminotransferase [Pseudomonadota bacterium]
CIDPDQLEDALSPRTEAVIVVHLACCMADMDLVSEICERRGLLLIEDCAHAHGARWRNRGAGSIGDLGSFSMQSSKLLTAGEGGLVTARDATTAQRLQSLVNCGRKEPGYDGFPEQMLGHNLRMTEWQAAIGRAQLARLPDQHRRREARLELFEKELAGIEGLRPLVRDERLTSRATYQFVLRYDPEAFAGVSRSRALAALRAEGVPCSGPFYVPLNEDPLYSQDPLTNPAARAGHAAPPRSFPVARRAAFEEAIWLPHELFLGSEADVSDLVAAFTKLKANAAHLRDARADP